MGFFGALPNIEHDSVQSLSQSETVAVYYLTRLRTYKVSLVIPFQQLFFHLNDAEKITGVAIK